MKKIILLVFAFGFLITIQAQKNTATPEATRSLENQVFQFMFSGTCTAWADSSKNNSTLYLWIPETCKQVKGLVIMCTNVPEHILVGDASIRKVCAENNLGIVWSTPTFMNFKKTTTKDNKTLNMALERKTAVTFLQQLLNGLAETSGYAEVATVPWLPMGESGHLLMVDALMEYSPERCIAGVYIKNNHLTPTNRTVPSLTVFGTAQEWGQDKVDMRKRWNDVGEAYEGILKQRRLYPNWPLSYVIDGASGHFDVSDKLAKYLANYIGLAAKARLSADGSATLKPVDITKGFLADMPVPNHENKPVIPYSKADTGYLASPWFFDKASAADAQAYARINWKAATQLPGFINDSGKIAAFNFNGISKLVPTDFGKDGITFTVKTVLLDEMPSNFVGAGEKLAKTKHVPVVEWACGQIKPLGNNQFQISLDRSYPNTANYVGARVDGSDTVRAIFQPCGISLTKNNVGKAQKITFSPISDVKLGTKSVPLAAVSDAGLPVSYYVVAGPAIVKNNELILTAIPPSAKFPITVTVAAWQWGSNVEPKVKMAEIVKQQFKIVK